MLSLRPLPILFGAALLAVVGALFVLPWAPAAGCAVALGVLAVHPAVTDSAVPRPARRLLRGGLLLLFLAVVVTTWGWAGSPFADTTPPSMSELIAMVNDPGRRWTEFLRELGVAVCLILACACFGVVIGRLPRDRLRRFGQAAPVVGVLTLVALVFLSLLPSGPGPLLGSFANVAVGVVLVLGGYVWLVRREVRRHGTASIAVAGATMLAAVAWVAADVAWRSLPDSRDSDAFLQPGVAVAVAVDTGLDVEAALTVAVLLLAAALTVLTCARLSTVDSQES